MDIKKILLPIDFSKCSDAALLYATNLAHQFGATLLIVHAEEPLSVYGGDEMREGELEAMLKQSVPTIPGIKCEHRLLGKNGNSAERILKAAQEENVDLIVIGTHGRTGVKRILVGSVAEAVVRNAECPVLLVKPSDDPRGMSHKSRLRDQSSSPPVDAPAE